MPQKICGFCENYRLKEHEVSAERPRPGDAQDPSIGRDATTLVAASEID